MTGPHVFKDGRIGLWIISPANLPSRLPKIKASFGGIVTDIFLPLNGSSPADRSHVKLVRDASFFANAYAIAPASGSGSAFATECLGRIATLGTGALEVDIEPGNDATIDPFGRSFMTTFRGTRPSYRVAFNIAPFKGGFLPIDLIRDDENLFVRQQTYYGDMSRVSEAECFMDLLDAGVPYEKAGLCYGAAALVPEDQNTERVVGLGTIWTWSNGQAVRPLRRGVIFQDDLLAEVGLI